MEEAKVRAYEIGYLVRSEEAQAVLVEHLGRAYARIISEGELRSIKLSYPIGHLAAAYFGYIHFEADPNAMAGLKNALKLDNEIIRFLIITPPFYREKTSPTVPPPERRPSPKPEVKERDGSVVSNDLLEEKLEEILNK